MHYNLYNFLYCYHFKGLAHEHHTHVTGALEGLTLRYWVCGGGIDAVYVAVVTARCAALCGALYITIATATAAVFVVVVVVRTVRAHDSCVG